MPSVVRQFTMQVQQHGTFKPGGEVVIGAAREKIMSSLCISSFSCQNQQQHCRHYVIATRYRERRRYSLHHHYNNNR
jgi:hypothetical protein